MAARNYTGGMRILPFLLIVSVGCSPSNAPTGPTLRLVDVDSDEFVNPMPFALRIVSRLS
jgi:hypothetical protein